MSPKRTTKSTHNLPWITNEIKRSMRKRDRLFHRARKSDSNIDWANFRKFRNSVAKSIISSHKNYINNVNIVENKMFLVICLAKKNRQYRCTHIKNWD